MGGAKSLIIFVHYFPLLSFLAKQVPTKARETPERGKWEGARGPAEGGRSGVTDGLLTEFLAKNYDPLRTCNSPGGRFEFRVTAT